MLPKNELSRIDDANLLREANNFVGLLLVTGMVTLREFTTKQELVETCARWYQSLKERGV